MASAPSPLARTSRVAVRRHVTACVAYHAVRAHRRDRGLPSVTEAGRLARQAAEAAHRSASHLVTAWRALQRGPARSPATSAQTGTTAGCGHVQQRARTREIERADAALADTCSTYMHKRIQSSVGTLEHPVGHRTLRTIDSFYPVVILISVPAWQHANPTDTKTP